MLKINNPNLFIAGFPKCGTSSLFYYLGKHDEIFASFRKEPHIYTFKTRFDNRMNKDEYLSFQNLYSEFDKEKYIVDASTTSMISNIALKRIKLDCPKAKIIIIARDPIERIFSHYKWIKSLNISVDSFRKEIIKWNNRDFNPNVVFNGNFKNYVEFSKYGDQIEKCLKIFPKEQLLVIPFEGMKNNFEEFMNTIFNFLNIESINVEPKVKNATIINRYRKRSFPKTFRYFYWNSPKTLRKQLSKWLSFLKFRKNREIKFNVEDEKFIFNLLKDDINKLKEIGYYFEEWKIVNKYY